MVRMHKRVSTGLKLVRDKVEFCSTWKDDFLCVYNLYFVLFIKTAFESLEFASYFKKKNKSKGLFVSKSFHLVRGLTLVWD